MDFYQNNSKIRDLKNPFSYKKEEHLNTLNLRKLIDHEKTSTPVLRYFAIDCAIAARKLYEHRCIEPLDNRLFNQLIRVYLDFAEGKASTRELANERTRYLASAIPVRDPVRAALHLAAFKAGEVNPRSAAQNAADKHLFLMLASPMPEGDARKHQILMLGRRICEEMEARRTLLEAFAKKIRIDTVVNSYGEELSKGMF